MIEPLLSDDALLADIEAAPRDNDRLHLWWLGQSGYLVQWQHTRVLIDPYLSDSLTKKYANTDKPHVRMTRRVVDPARLRQISYVTSSHSHTDHLDPETLQAVRRGNDSAVFIAPAATKEVAAQRWGAEPNVLLDDGDRRTWGGFGIEAIAAAHDQLDRDAHGRHLYLGYVLRLGAFSIYHSGDTVVYDGLAERLQRQAVDLAILPINGQVGNMNGRDAAQVAHAAGAKLVVPCHYDMFTFNTASPDEQFVPECRRLGQPFRVLRCGQRLTLAPERHVLTGGIQS